MTVGSSVRAIIVPGLGLSVVQRGDSAEVVAVEPGGPAAKRHLRAGDRILAVDGVGPASAGTLPASIAGAAGQASGKVSLVVANTHGRQGTIVFTVAGTYAATPARRASTAISVVRPAVVGDDGVTVCPWCAEDVRPEAKLCPHCRSPLHADAAAMSLRAPSSGQTNPFAVASLILGILGSGFLAVILGTVAKSQIRKSGGAQQGDGIATAGIVLGALAILAYMLLLTVVA